MARGGIASLRTAAWPIFGLVALIPATLAPESAAASQVLQISICTGTGSGPARTVDIPVPRTPEKNGNSPCCAKACHSAGSRKRASADRPGN